MGDTEKPLSCIFFINLTLLVRSHGWENFPAWLCLFVGQFLLDFLIIIHSSTHSTLWGKFYIVCICIVYCYIALLGSCKNRIEFSDPQREQKILIYQATVISLGLFENKNSLIVLKKQFILTWGRAVLGGIQNGRFWVAVVTLW